MWDWGGKEGSTHAAYAVAAGDEASAWVGVCALRLRHAERAYYFRVFDQAISKPRNVPFPVENSFVSIPSRCSMETYKFVSG